jgi:hypothetical protein
MKRQASISIGTVLLLFGLTGCPDATSTSPVTARASDAALRLQQAGDVKLTLHPSGFGRRSYAAWKAQEGRPDSEGTANTALYFQKMVPTPTVAAGLAVIQGVAGLPASAITGLSWEHRIDGHCGAGAPRWNLGVTAPNGQRFTVFLGCAAAAHTPAGTDDAGRAWIRDSYPGVGTGGVVVGSPADFILAQTGFEASDLTVRSLIIVFDEGNDLGFPGYVHLDNITVSVDGTPHVFTGPMDNRR